MKRLTDQGTLEGEISSWERHLDTGNLSPKTVTAWTSGVRKLAEFLAERGRSTRVKDVRRGDLEEFLAHALEHSCPWTALTRHRDLQAFFKWQVDIGALILALRCSKEGRHGWSPCGARPSSLSLGGSHSS